jgi:riboflavin biosynthesis pyrimidine reductase
MDVVEINAATGEVIERDFTPEEIAQREADATAHGIRQAAEAILSGNKTTLTDRATSALVANRDFLALASPTQADALAQIKDLTRQNTALIRLILGLLDGTD